MKERKSKSLSVGDRIFIVSGKYENNYGVIEAPSVIRGKYICKITSVQPNMIEVFSTTEFVRNSLSRHKVT